MAAEIDENRGGELMHMLKHDCGSCHGLTLRGGLGPPLTADRLHGYPLDFISNTILNGRAGTAMPPWRGLLTEDEVNWIAERLLEGAAE